MNCCSLSWLCNNLLHFIPGTCSMPCLSCAGLNWRTSKQEELVHSLEIALQTQILPEITQTLLNMAELMEHTDKVCVVPILLDATALPHTSLPYHTLSDVHRTLLHPIVLRGFSSKPWGILTHSLALQTRNIKVAYHYLISLHNGVPSC